MTAANNILAELAEIGATVEPAGEQLILRAGPTAISPALMRRVREAKSQLISFLRAQPAENNIIDWLNDHPEPSIAGRCAWCGKSESPDAVVMPFGTDPGTHTWLHADCWVVWERDRRARATASIAGVDSRA
jgi:hypothetical protein